MTQILQGHDSPESAYIQHDYPFGRGRCVRLAWVETATKGAKKGQQRAVFQTTHKSWNAGYTESIDEEVPFDQIVLPPPRLWNNPKAGNYYDLVVLYLDENEHIQIAGLSVYSGPDKFQEFTDLVDGQLTEYQNDRLYILEQASRRFAKSSWAEHDAAQTAEVA